VKSDVVVGVLNFGNPSEEVRSGSV